MFQDKEKLLRGQGSSPDLSDKDASSVSSSSCSAEPHKRPVSAQEGLYTQKCQFSGSSSSCKGFLLTLQDLKKRHRDSSVSDSDDGKGLKRKKQQVRQRLLFAFFLRKLLKAVAVVLLWCGCCMQVPRVLKVWQNDTKGLMIILFRQNLV